MGNQIYIAPPEETEWRIPPEEFAAHLSRRWKVNRIGWIDDPDDPNAFQFEISTPDGWMDGYFAKDGTMLVLDERHVWDIGEIAVWFRSLVPPEQPLLIFSGGGTGFSELKPTDTAEEVNRRFSS
jgi:hypothetical protein